MKLGIISSYDDEGFELAKRHGLSFIELCYNVGKDCNEIYNSIDEINERIKKYGIEMGSIGRWGSDKIDKQGNIIEEELQNSYVLIDVCEAVGCNVFNTGVNYVKELSKFANVSCAIEFLGKLIDYAKPKGVRIATYNCDWNNFIHTPEYWSLIHGHLKDLGIKYDPTHCINCGSGDYLGEMKDWGSRFYHVHIKGTINIFGDHVDDPPAGLDMINWGAFMGILYSCGYDGTLSIEPHSRTWRGELAEPGISYTIKHISQFIFK
ncbi:MAG: sugar phosphate isomerase/epimerase [Clostridiales bacterium]|nr:sugar phosphate isomerase/epimerase [Clostridiales bacterium]